MRKYAVAGVVLAAVLVIAVLVQRQVTRTAEHGGPVDGAPPLVGEAPPVGALGDTIVSVAPGEPLLPAPGGPAAPATRNADRGTSPARPAEPLPGEQATPQGARILQQASEVYAGIRTMQADFTMVTENPLLRTAVTSRGTLYQHRPDRIALRFTDPAGDVIVGDGTHFWIYYPSTDARQVIRSPADAGGSGGVDLQAQFLGDPVRRFEHTLHETETVRGRENQVMTLVPREQLGYARLRVWIDTQDRLVRRFEITEHNGAVRMMDLENLRTNVSISDDVFRFLPPADARIIDRG
jgi:outer membrane lipoprotein-sorting protein